MARFNVQIFSKGNSKNENPEPVECFTAIEYTGHTEHVAYFRLESGEEIYTNMDFIVREIKEG